MTTFEILVVWATFLTMYLWIQTIEARLKILSRNVFRDVEEDLRKRSE